MVCRNALKVPIDRLEHVITETMKNAVLHPDIVSETIDGPLRSCGGPPGERISPGVGATSRKSIQRTARSPKQSRQVGNSHRLDALKATDAGMRSRTRSPRTPAIDVARIDRRRIDQKARRCVANWRARLEGSVSDSPSRSSERSSSVQSS